jgi:hypothetical protein
MYAEAANENRPASERVCLSMERRMLLQDMLPAFGAMMVLLPLAAFGLFIALIVFL